MNRYEYENWIEIDYDKVLETTDMTLEEAKARLEITYKASGFIKKDEGYYIASKNEDENFDCFFALVYLVANKEEWIITCAKYWKCSNEEDGDINLLKEFEAISKELEVD